MKMQSGSVNKISVKKDIKELVLAITRDMVTRDEFWALRHEFEDFRTKAFETFATKEDLQNFATKEDLENFSNRAFETFATKRDLQDFSIKAFEMFATKDDLKELEERLPSRQRVEEIYDLLDSVAKDMKDIKQELIFINYRVERLEKRVEKLEAHFALES